MVRMTMPVGENVLDRMRRYFSDRGLGVMYPFDPHWLCMMTPEQGIRRLSAKFLNLSVRVDGQSYNVAWVLKELIDAGHDGIIHLYCHFDTCNTMKLHWGNLSDRSWPWIVEPIGIDFSAVDIVFGSPRELPDPEPDATWNELADTFRKTLKEIWTVLPRHAPVENGVLLSAGLMVWLRIRLERMEKALSACTGGREKPDGDD
jgi:hypothetical protein